MTQVQGINQTYPNQNTGTPLYNYPTAAVPAMPVSTVATNNGQQGTVSVSTPNGYSQVYSYPTASVYGSAQQPQATSGVNIHIYNPSAIGGPTSNSTANANYASPNGAQPWMAYDPKQAASSNSSAIANTSLNSEKTDDSKKKKQIVELTDDYIKTLESYLKSADADIRKSGIVDLINRFEEDSSRYDDPALTALLNIALQDPNANNRLLAMSPIAGENAHGDKNTINLLKSLQKSDKLYGQEAKMANESLLKSAQTKKEVSV